MHAAATRRRVLTVTEGDVTAARERSCTDGVRGACCAPIGVHTDVAEVVTEGTLHRAANRRIERTAGESRDFANALGCELVFLRWRPRVRERERFAPTRHCVGRAIGFALVRVVDGADFELR